MVGLYLFAILCGVLFALVLKHTAFRGEPVPFVMELPNYRLPSARNVAQLIWEKARDFIQRAFTIIFVATVIIWFLQTFDLRLNVAASADSSLLAMLGSLIAPVFAPLGFGDWRASNGADHRLYGQRKRRFHTDRAAGRGYGAALSTMFTPVHGGRVSCLYAAVHPPAWRPLRRSSGSWAARARPSGWRCSSA